ncbi:hypothetical protein LY76DRAFT_258570 [Colletotrichum caudatum]|nr:hypothetical protein LY76DRAFT_258570 [Colletotrichum caudatum]
MQGVQTFLGSRHQQCKTRKFYHLGSSQPLPCNFWNIFARMSKHTFPILQSAKGIRACGCVPSCPEAAFTNFSGAARPCTGVVRPYASRAPVFADQASSATRSATPHEPSRRQPFALMLTDVRPVSEFRANRGERGWYERESGQRFRPGGRHVPEEKSGVASAVSRELRRTSWTRARGDRIYPGSKSHSWRCRLTLIYPRPPNLQRLPKCQRERGESSSSPAVARVPAAGLTISMPCQGKTNADSRALCSNSWDPYCSIH